MLLGDAEGRRVPCGQERWEQRKVDAAEIIAALGVKVAKPRAERKFTVPDEEADAWIGFKTGL